MSTPGCFSFFKKAKAPAPTPTPAMQTVQAPQAATPKYTPHLPTAAEHYEPCFQCSEGFGKMTLDGELPAYTARKAFSSDVS